MVEAGQQPQNLHECTDSEVCARHDEVQCRRSNLCCDNCRYSDSSFARNDIDLAEAVPLSISIAHDENGLSGYIIEFIDRIDAIDAKITKLRKAFFYYGGQYCELIKGFMI